MRLNLEMDFRNLLAKTLFEQVVLTPTLIMLVLNTNKALKYQAVSSIKNLIISIILSIVIPNLKSGIILRNLVIRIPEILHLILTPIIQEIILSLTLLLNNKN
jgi:hypothetical protein